jgi:hypothetical protein
MLIEIEGLTTDVNSWLWENKVTVAIVVVAAPVAIAGGPASAAAAVVVKGVLIDEGTDVLMENLLPKVFGDDACGRQTTKSLILVKKLVLLGAHHGLPSENAYWIRFAYGAGDTTSHALYVLEDFLENGCPSDYIDLLASSDNAVDVVIRAPSNRDIGLEATIICIDTDEDTLGAE